MIKGAGGVGPTTWKALFLQQKTEQWTRDIIKQIREGKRQAPEFSAAHVIANHRDLDGALLPLDVAAVELINIMRPTVAVTRFIVFAAHALYHYPQSRRYLEAGTDTETEVFVQEVRRFYPFFPFIGGRVQQPFTWRDHEFTPGTWVILDIYGTDRDSRLWENPEAFHPERFRDWNGSAFIFIPQGAGDHWGTHRCAGEWITIALLKQAAAFLATGMTYTVPEQDLSINLRVMPALPQSGFIITDIEPVA